MTARALSLGVAIFLCTLVLSSFLAGDIFLKIVLRDSERFNNISTRLSAGILSISVLLYSAALALPFGLTTKWLILVAAVLIIWFRVRRADPGCLLRVGHSSESIFIVVASMAVTLWCRDLLHPIDTNRGIAVIRAWGDVYYHLSQIGAFAVSKGVGTIFDVQMAGTIAQPYHFASYIIPAVLVNATATSAWVAYASFLVPFGVLVSALAAYALASSVFGRWPALAAGLALLLFPDAVQQGFGNPFFGYHWLQQVGPAGSYGVACAALALMLMLEACRTAHYRLIFFSYGFVLFTLLFKAQIFVAISFLILVFPPLFMPGMATQYRILSLLALTGVYLGVVTGSQMIPGVPVLRLDGSSLRTYSVMVLNMTEEGVFKRLGTVAFDAAGNNWWLRAGAFASMLMIWTFGIFPALYAAQLGRMRRQFPAAVWVLPAMVLTIYLVMATCLSLDDRRIGRPEELLHRPFVWAYFLLVVWLSAAAYHRRFGDALPASRYARLFLVSLTILLMVVPVRYGRRIQTMKSWGVGYQELPACLIDVANHIRTNSRVDEVVQDAMNGNVLPALSERKAFAIDFKGVRALPGSGARLQSLQAMKGLQDVAQVDDFMRQNAIDWYVVSPAEDVKWTPAMKDRLVFECGGYRAYRFSAAPAMLQ